MDKNLLERRALSRHPDAEPAAWPFLRMTVQSPSLQRWLLALSIGFTTVTCANDLQQQYEKAYYLETAKRQTQQAAAIYQEIAQADPSEENRPAIQSSLTRLLGIAVKRKHEPTIQLCHEQLLAKTGFTLQELIDLTDEGSTVFIPNGIHEGTIELNKDITLQGTGTNSVLKTESDKPLVHVMKKTEVTLKNLTLKSMRETSERQSPPGCAVYVKDAKSTIVNCRIEAAGNPAQCPAGIFIDGFSEAQILNSHCIGYDFTIQFGEGAKGLVKGCIVEKPGHCGFTAFSGAEAAVEENIFTGSGYHGVRSTGGTIHVQNNLIIANKNRGIYLGNKTAHGEIINNAIIGNGSGISAFASADLDIENNVILNNGFSGIDTRCYGKIQVKNNIIAGNKKTGFGVFEEGSNKFKVGKNTFFGNGEPSTDYKLPSSTITEDPRFKDPDNGDFAVGNSSVRNAEHGLIDTDIIAALWKKYKELSK